MGFNPPNRELCSLSRAGSSPKLEGLTWGQRKKVKKKRKCHLKICKVVTSTWEAEAGGWQSSKRDWTIPSLETKERKFLQLSFLGVSVVRGEWKMFSIIHHLTQQCVCVYIYTYTIGKKPGFSFKHRPKVTTTQLPKQINCLFVYLLTKPKTYG